MGNFVIISEINVSFLDNGASQLLKLDSFHEFAKIVLMHHRVLTFHHEVEFI